MFIIFLSICLSQGMELTNVTQSITYANMTQINISKEIEFDKEYEIFNFTDHGAIYDSQVQSEYQMCKLKPQQIKMNQQKMISIIPKEETIYYKSSGTELVGMAQLPNKIALISSSYYLYVYNLNTFEQEKQLDFSTYSQDSSEFQIAVYSLETEFLYIIYDNYIIILDKLYQINTQSIKLQSIIEAMSSQGYIYIATNSKLYVYKIQQNGELQEQVVTIQGAIEDLSLGGNKGQYLYVLTKTNLQIYEIKIENNQLQLIQSNIGQINITNGYALDHNNDQQLLILSKISQAHVTLHIFGINIEKGIWFKINQFNLKGDVKNLNVNDNFAVIQGVDSQYIIDHQSYSLFNKQTQIQEQSFHFASVIDLEFYKPVLGQSINSWFQSDIKSIIIGIDPDDLYFFGWTYQIPTINCKADAANLIGKNVNYNFNIISSNCTQKSLLLEQNQSSDLIACRQGLQLDLKVIDNSESLRKQLLITTVIFLGIGFFTLIVIAVVCYQNNKFLRGRLQKYEHLPREQQQDIKMEELPQSLPALNQFKIDEDD